MKEIKPNTAIPISEVMDNPEIQEIVKKIQSGQLSLGTGDDIPEWTQEEEQRLTNVLAEIYGWDNPSRDK